jgi:phage baseplate assembly protein W
MNTNLPFHGTGWRFPPRFNKVLRTVEMTSGEEDIRNSLKILLSTALGERLIEPSYGCNLQDLVFEPLDEALTAHITDLIKKAVLYHESRIVLEDVQVQESPENGRLLITLEYTIPTTNSRSNFVFPYFLDEGTSIEAAYKKLDENEP